GGLPPLRSRLRSALRKLHFQRAGLELPFDFAKLGRVSRRRLEATLPVDNAPVRGADEPCDHALRNLGHFEHLCDLSTELRNVRDGAPCPLRRGPSLNLVLLTSGHVVLPLDCLQECIGSYTT